MHFAKLLLREGFLTEDGEGQCWDGHTVRILSLFGRGYSQFFVDRTHYSTRDTETQISTILFRVGAVPAFP